MTNKKGFKKKYTKGVKASGDSISDPIIEAIQKGQAPWMNPSIENPPMVPRNAVTGQLFSGLKAVSILATGMTDPRWCTYKQAADSGWQVQKNPVSVKMMYFNVLPSAETIDEKTGLTVTSGQKVFKPYFVFNASQIKGVPELDLAVERQWGDPLAIQEVIANSGVKIKHGADVARYNKEDDNIEMPDFSSYADELNYYADLVPELARWTGGAERLGRTLSEEDVDVIEELKVGIASYMLAAEYGLPFNPKNLPTHAEEIVDILNSDKREIGRVSMAAKDVCDYVSQFAPAPDFMLSNTVGEGLFEDDYEGQDLSDNYDIVPETSKKLVSM